MNNPNPMISDLMQELCQLREQFEEHEKANPGFNSENPYYRPIKELLEQIDQALRRGEALDIEFRGCSSLSDFLDTVANDRPARLIVKFSSDAEGNYYFNGRKVLVVYDGDYAYRLRKKTIYTSSRRPVDFFFSFLDRFGPYGTYGNSFWPCVTDMICAKYLK